jgi:hypothetical protein
VGTSAVALQEAHSTWTVFVPRHVTNVTLASGVRPKTLLIRELDVIARVEGGSGDAAEEVERIVAGVPRGRA